LHSVLRLTAPQVVHIDLALADIHMSVVDALGEVLHLVLAGVGLGRGLRVAAFLSAVVGAEEAANEGVAEGDAYEGSAEEQSQRPKSLHYS